MSLIFGRFSRKELAMRILTPLILACCIGLSGGVSCVTGHAPSSSSQPLAMPTAGQSELQHKQEMAGARVLREAAEEKAKAKARAEKQKQAEIKAGDKVLRQAAADKAKAGKQKQRETLNAAKAKQEQQAKAAADAMQVEKKRQAKAAEAVKVATASAKPKQEQTAKPTEAAKAEKQKQSDAMAAAKAAKAEKQRQADIAEAIKEATANAKLKQAPQAKKALAVNEKPQPTKPGEPASSASMPVPAAPTYLTLTKEQKLNELTRRYKNDEITPLQYQTERARIIAEP
jgi:DNA polymerase III gamma/tau subunit